MFYEAKLVKKQFIRADLLSAPAVMSDNKSASKKNTKA